ncbi:hypothetical protein MYX84_10205, partial [Acidobacteria bacterium AH-259-O06]|nr:hypothetical protein [Acidobacteria bacterium AH-259-O06]
MQTRAKRRIILLFLIGTAFSPAALGQVLKNLVVGPALAESILLQREPDLNLLRQRVMDFWALLQQGRRREALEYVDPPTHDTFLNRRELSFSSFVIRSIRVQDRPTVAVVTVVASARLPLFAHTLEFPVEEYWVFHDGNWYVHIEGSRFKELFGSREARAERERMIQELGRFTALSIDPSRLLLDDSSAREILIQNKTDREIQIRRAVSSADFLQVEWDSDKPKKIAPGARIALKVRWDQDRLPRDWSGGSIELELAEPVEG